MSYADGGTRMLKSKRKRSSLSEIYRKGEVRRIKQKREKNDIAIFKQKHALFMPLFPFILQERMDTYRTKVFDVLSFVFEVPMSETVFPLIFQYACHSGPCFGFKCFSVKKCTRFLDAVKATLSRPENQGQISNLTLYDPPLNDPNEAPTDGDGSSIEGLYWNPGKRDAYINLMVNAETKQITGRSEWLTKRDHFKRKEVPWDQAIEDLMLRHSSGCIVVF